MRDNGATRWLLPRLLSRIEVQGGVKEDNNIELHSGEYFISVHIPASLCTFSRAYSPLPRFSSPCFFSLHGRPRAFLPSAALSIPPRSRSSASDRTAEHARYVPSRAAGCQADESPPSLYTDPLPCTREKSPRVTALWPFSVCVSLFENKSRL